MYFKIVLLGVIFTILFQNVENLKVFKFSSVYCNEMDKKFIEFKYCHIKAIQRDVSELTLWAILHQKPVDNVTIDFNIRRRGLENVKLLEASIDACKFLRNKRRNPLAELLHNFLGFEKYSNMNHSCPYDHDIILNKLRIDDEKVKLILLPAGHYVLSSKWFAYAKLRFETNINFQLLD